jgi:subtilase family serine protease
MWLFLVGSIFPSNVTADCGSFIYISNGSSSSSSSNNNPPVNIHTALPDFIIKTIWLSDSAGNAKTVFTPGQAMQIHIEVKNVGADTGAGIDVDYFRSNGYYKDADPSNVGTDFIHKDDLKGGHTHGELKNTTAPTSKGIYNMTAQADAGSSVNEEHESNNWSDEAVFEVNESVNSNWLIPVINYILN